MPTKPKETVEYFPHYCDYSASLVMIEDEFKNDGYVAWFKLLELLGKKKGHFIDLRERQDRKYLLAKTRLSGDYVYIILTRMADYGMIDPDLFDRDILWSYNFVDNLRPVYARRNCNMPEKPHYDDRNPTERGLCMQDVNRNPANSGIHATAVNMMSTECAGTRGTIGTREREERACAREEEEPRSGRRFFLPLHPVDERSPETLDLAQVFINFNPTGFPDHQNQIIALRDIVVRCEKLASNSRDGPAAGDIALAFIDAFKDLREHDDSEKGFWRKMPMLPKFMLTHWAQIFEHVKEQGNLAGAAEDMREILEDIHF